ncbi:MAG: hypothetical protein HYT35_00630, partial [Candidatus Staskawiczbacteria bacterium]|nr:hypothetical protein [Candidatus Staskawiczbacteria bacterium]
LPANIPLGRYKAEVSISNSYDNRTYLDTSDNYFNITGLVYLTPTPSIGLVNNEQLLASISDAVVRIAENIKEILRR